jgi:hypothetical protein
MIRYFCVLDVAASGNFVVETKVGEKYALFSPHPFLRLSFSILPFIAVIVP